MGSWIGKWIPDYTIGLSGWPHPGLIGSALPVRPFQPLPLDEGPNLLLWPSASAHVGKAGVGSETDIRSVVWVFIEPALADELPHPKSWVNFLVVA